MGLRVCLAQRSILFVRGIFYHEELFTESYCILGVKDEACKAPSATGIHEHRVQEPVWKLKSG